MGAVARGWIPADPLLGVNVMTCAAPVFSLTTKALHRAGWPVSLKKKKKKLGCPPSSVPITLLLHFL